MEKKDKDKYIKKLESNMGKYTDKLSKLDAKLKTYKAHNKEQVMAERKILLKNLKAAEVIFTKLKGSSLENFEEIKKAAADSFEVLQDSFEDFADLLTMDRIHHMKDEAAAYAAGKVEDIEDCVHKKPLICLAAAIGIGVLIGAIFMRSK